MRSRLARAVRVPVVNIADVRMGMDERTMDMGMTVRFGRIDTRLVLMLVMLVMYVAMVMLQERVGVLVCMLITDEEQHSHRHRERGGNVSCAP